MSKWLSAIGIVAVGGLSAAIVNSQPASESSVLADGSGVNASSSAATGSNELAEVIVTARRKEERQQDVPLAITTLSGEFLTENAIVGLHDLNGHVPGLNIDNYNSPLYTNIGIRGQRSTNIAPGQDPAVGYYFSEVSYSYPVSISQQLFDLQSVEVVKGPQGTLFGRNTTGGAVVITPAKPTNEFGGSVTAGMTDFNNGTGWYTTDVINLPVNDNLQLRAAVRLVEHDGYVKNLITQQQLNTFEIAPFGGVSSANPDDEYSLAGRVSALLRLSDSLESYFMVQGNDYRDHGTAYSLTALAPNGFANFALSIIGANGEQVLQSRQAQQANNFWTTQSGMNAYNHSDSIGSSNTTTWTASDALTVKNIVGYRHFDQNQAVPLDGVPYQILNSYIGDMGHEFSEELQLQGKIDDQFNWAAGYYYAAQHIDHPRATVALPQFGTPTSHAEEISDNGSYAEYAQGTLKIPAVQALSFTAGLRNTRDERKMTSMSWNNPAQTSCAISGVVDCELIGNITYNVITWNLSIDYKLDADTLLYATRRKGYRAGGWNYVGSDPVSFGPFRPEFVYDWEVGLKKDWHIGDAILRTNLAIYRSNLIDAQKFLSPVSNPNDFEVINAATATVNGGELEVTFVPVKGLELGGYLSVIDAYFNGFVFGGNNFTNNSFAQTPKTQYSLRASYELPLNAAIGIISPMAQYSHQSHIFYTDTAQGPTQGPTDSQGQNPYGILNLRLDWKSIFQSKVDAAVYVNNATATKYNSFGVLLYPSLGYNVATIGDPRIFGLEATYRF
jgi:iron complex outermembrane receptor protein